MSASWQSGWPHLRSEVALAMIAAVAGLAGSLRWKDQRPLAVAVELTADGSIAWNVSGSNDAIVAEREGATPWLALGMPIPLNASSASDLVEIRGIGPARAAAIVGYRSSNGPFARLSDLKRVKGIGPKTAAKIAPFVDVGVMSGLSPAAP